MRLTATWVIRFIFIGLAAISGVRAQVAPAILLPQEGMASWYGSHFDGQKSASGEIFHEEELTAAHRTLPFGTLVRVRRMGSPASVVVRITDRGPFVESRIIDLSYAAARHLGMTQPGTVPVSIELAGETRPSEGLASVGKPFAVKTGTFRNPDNARRTQAIMQKFGEARVVPANPAGDLWSVLVSAANETEAQELAARIRQSGAAFESAYVVKADR